ncbi:copper homeostasis protein CutC [Anaerocolumna aminovalerica]|jgi:copper homeostasis protein|uniref:PF03932 family protein CutC n=1 Tax=Anaerocolumna aminovalerica TaxID=1527 RepID=A0A1I5FMF9_9FIRM|nr:copper homeostasis protein CutC [Anaerocolumna aminovalerica]MBU5331628.1 copper homeostasis protein CutC [Anaerocolumna aminovalerica]MDU6265351.1 copper homeostasis protein CutC [Anaerocolumna aminovalerica]SFO24968.1 copper homeostasis protein [Anaerocolumna aminovalerica]
MENYILEACVDSVESAVIATDAGANRLEFCANLVIGGTTPTLAMFQQVRKRCDNKIHVLIRPRFGDFCYTEDEFEVMKEEVKQYKKFGAEGIAIGILTPEGELNMQQMAALRKEAGNMSVTLHRAFDMCKDPKKTLEQAIELGINGILTSGQANDCVTGKDCLKKLYQESNHRIDILVGSGVNASVIKEIYQHTGATSYHMSGKKAVNSAMVYRKENIFMGLDGFDEYSIWRTDKTEIERAVTLLKEL